MVRIASIAFAWLCACAERPAVEDSSIDIDPVERQKMYLAQERAQLKRTTKSQARRHRTQRYGMYELSMAPGEGTPANLAMPLCTAQRFICWTTAG